ncbi:flavodoxin [Aquimarina sp. 2201CG5-10]|uniref:flavodoxin n=1 Tax=Aquimarina callyspongiae TaxID=3098150 RepID=UPI002AB3BF57|nr:flavodoxin [Aquimarina sp. 2201CG5-10]MDY8135939.1 flavodoxin [Aquimarina sp. 2201CG5-10]
MKKIALFYGSDTGCTDDITKDVVSIWGSEELDVCEISDVTIEKFDDYEIFLFGLSTWYDGDLQSDWEAFFDDFKEIDFTNKVVAIYGLGDQIGYGEYFVDGIGILAKVILENGGTIIGHWPYKGYRFTDSVAMIADKEGYFYGLAIDHDNESQLTDERLEKWIIQVKSELKPYYTMVKEAKLT